MALLWKSTIAFHSLMARKPKGREKSCIAAPLRVRNNILLLRKLVVVKIKFRQNLMQKTFMKSPHKSTRGKGGYWCCPRGPNILSFLGALFQY